LQLLIGLGGNRGDVAAAFAAAVAGLAHEVAVLARSSLWRSAPLGPPQPDYLNAAVLVDAPCHPRALLALCRRLEEAGGRDRARESRWGPRPLDLDLLIAPGLAMLGAEVELPHPRLAERRFALEPAAELAPDWMHPRSGLTLRRLALEPSVAAQRCERVATAASWGDSR